MTPSLTPQQREEVLEAAFTAYIERIEARTGVPVIRSEVNDARLRDSLQGALDAALPVIWRACLERESSLARLLLCIDFERFTEHDEALLDDVLAAARALAEETR